MATRQLTCPTVLRLLLRYDPGTGNLYWRERAPIWFKTYTESIDALSKNKADAKRWNTRLSDKAACCLKEKNGYLTGSLMGRKYLAHRIIWAMQTGSWPEEQIDHINGVRDDNRWENLRAVSCTINNRNQRRNKVGKSCVAGVRFCRHSGRWVVQVRAGDGRRICRSSKSMEEAIEMHESIKKGLGYTEDHGRVRL
jgi:hypothetical protein